MNANKTSHREAAMQADVGVLQPLAWTVRGPRAESRRWSFTTAEGDTAMRTVSAILLSEVVAMVLSAQTFTRLLSFDGKDGRTPSPPTGTSMGPPRMAGPIKRARSSRLPRAARSRRYTLLRKRLRGRPRTHRRTRAGHRWGLLRDNDLWQGPWRWDSLQPVR